MAPQDTLNDAREFIRANTEASSTDRHRACGIAHFMTRRPNATHVTHNLFALLPAKNHLMRLIFPPQTI